MSTPELLWDRWSRRSAERPDGEAVVHWKAGEPPVRWTWRRLVDAALEAACSLEDSGVRPGEVCALIVRHNPYFYPVYLGVSALGAIPAVLAYPNSRLHPQKFAQGLAGMSRRSGLDWVLTERDLDPVVRPLVTGGSSIRGLIHPLEWRRERSRAARPNVAGICPDDPCLLQHSSGTTGLQKAVMLSHRAVLQHVDAYGETLHVDPARDKIVSWLPLYHDMGMIAAFHLALALGVPTIQIDPFEWVAYPELLLQVASSERATLTWLPNFAYNFLADRARDEELQDVRLDSVRMYVNCSEPVRKDSHDRFLRRFQPLGARPDALAACYAMAETTFAATQTAPGVAARAIVVDRAEVARGRVRIAGNSQSQRACVSSGRPIQGCEVKVVDESGSALASGMVGELAIRSASLFDGYRNNPDDTRRVLRDGWYYSGDLGFWWEDEIFVVGRKKDILIVAGNNIFPEDIEDAVGRVPGVIPGRVIAFGMDEPDAGTESACVIVESEVAEANARKQLSRAVVRAAMTIDVTISRVYIAPPRWLIKSSSGKPSRSANRQRVLDGALEPS